MKKLILSMIAITMSFFVFSQNELDALRFSQTYYFGTSRTMGMANAFSALGADPGSFAINPAALGLLRHNDYNLTLGFKMNKTNSMFNGTPSSEIKYSFMLNNLTFAWAKQRPQKAFKYFNFALQYNKLVDYNSRIFIQGQNPKGSMIDYFVYLANGTPPLYLDDFYTYPAYKTYLIDVADTNNWTYFGANDIDGKLYYDETQTRYITRTGSGGTYDFSFATNFQDIFFIGATFSIISMKFSEVSTHNESDFPSPVDLKSFEFTQNISDKVTGYGAKIGMTLVPVKFIRLSLSAQSPYMLKVTDNFNTSLSSYWHTPDSLGYTSYQYYSAYNTFNYSISTPWKVTTGIGFIFKKLLAFDAEIDYLDYSLIRMSSQEDNFFDANTAIENNFKSAINFRTGLELNLGVFQIRGGFAQYGKAYDRLSNTNVYALGFGLRSDQFYFDMAFNYRTYKENYWLYIPYEDEPMPDLTFNNYYISFTMGYKF